MSEHDTVSLETARQLAKDMLHIPDGEHEGCCWVDDLGDTEDSLTEWFVEWFKKRSLKEAID